MELSYRQLEATLAAHFRIHPDRVGTFRSRIRQLQRLDFPPDSKVGKGEKIRYSVTQLFQFVAAFELINAGFTAGLAVEIVSKKWENFAAGFGLALWHRRRLKLDRLVYVRLKNAALFDIQGVREGDEVPSVFVEDSDSLIEAMKRIEKRSTHTYTVMCVTDIIFSVAGWVKDVAQGDDLLDEDDTAGWLPRRNLGVEHWMRAKDESLLEEDVMPEGNPPYFLAIEMSQILQDHPGLAYKLITSDPVGQTFQANELEVMVEYGLLKNGPRKEDSPRLTPKGRAICQYLRREEEHLLRS